MKKLLCLLLSVTLLASASVVMAEEAVEEELPEGIERLATPDIPYGTNMTEAMERIESSFSYSGVQLSETQDRNTRTLSNGKQYLEIAVSGASEDDSYQIEAKFYFTGDGMTIGGTQEYILTETVDLSMLEDRLSESLGEPETVDLDALGDYAELIGETAHLENGQKIWHYTAEVPVIGEGGFLIDSIPVNVYITMQLIDDHMYMAEFMNPPSLSQKEGTADPVDVNGFDQLTPEEQQAVSLYAEYLEAQKQTQLEQYVDFLLKKH